MSRLLGADFLTLELERLTLDIPFIDKPLELRPSFQLRFLGLSDVPPPHVFNALLASSPSTLRILFLQFQSELPNLSHLLPAISLLCALESLRTNCLRLRPGLGPIVASLPSFTHLLTLLDELDNVTALDNLLSAFHPPLESLVVAVFGFTPADGGFLPTLAEKVGKKGWEGVERVVVGGKEGLIQCDEVEFLAKLCAEKDVEVRR